MNPRHRAYQLLYSATTELRQGAGYATQTPKTPSCACCDRPWAVVEMPFQAAEYRYGKNGETEYVCLTCYSPRIPSERLLGLERENVTGNTRTPIYGKLGMLVGSGGIITPDAKLYLTLPPKLHEKYRHGEWGQQGRLSTEKPLARLLALLANRQCEPLAEGFVYIENWGRKVDGLMRHLTPTTSLHELWCNSESGVSVLDLHAMIVTAQQLREQGLSAQGERITFWKPILDAAKGQRDEAAFAAWVAKVPNPTALMQALPADPFDRLKLPAVMGAVMPYLDALLPYCEGALLATPPYSQPLEPSKNIPTGVPHQSSLF